MKRPVDIRMMELLKLFTVPDIFQFYSPAYSWLVNQIGHTLAGLVVAMAVLSGLETFTSHTLLMNCFLTLLAGFIIYGVKEYNDFRESRKSDRTIVETLRVTKKELFYDCATDWFFVNAGVLIGVCITAAFIEQTTRQYFLFSMLVSLIIVLSGFWFIGRAYIEGKLLWQLSNLPYLKDIAHCPADWINPNEHHITQQLSSFPKSTHYVGSFNQVNQLLSGLSRRIMANSRSPIRRVRYWQVAELIEALQEQDISVNESPAWCLEEAHIHVVWVGDATLPVISSETLNKLKDSIWLIGAATEILPDGWNQLGQLERLRV